MPNPYHGRPDYTFWSKAVSDRPWSAVDPVVSAPFTIRRDDRIATAGSCFAQHISRTLREQGFGFFVTETFAAAPGVTDENFAVFSARFGNIYTARQLLQLFDRACGDFVPEDSCWIGPDGTVVDPFRPRIQAGGFAAIECLRQDRERHLAAVRRMFEQCNVFIFTLGLTEAWISTTDGAVFPLAPGVVCADPPGRYAFRNFRMHEIVADMIGFVDRLAAVNRSARVILTVSPVPLIATYEDRHVLVSTIASKSVLRAAVDETIRERPSVAYFPSYEIVTGPQAGGRYYAPDAREVTAAGVAHVMSLFGRHYLRLGEAQREAPGEAQGEAPGAAAGAALDPDDERRMAEWAAIVCDEEAIDP